MGIEDEQAALLSALRRSVEVFDKAGTVTRGQVEREIADDLDASASISEQYCADRVREASVLRRVAEHIRNGAYRRPNGV